MKKICLILALVLILSVAAVGCGGGTTQSSASLGTEAPVSQAPETKTYKIGFSNSFSGNAWRATMLASLDKRPRSTTTWT
jgi:ABC-type sugar transport system substrate-binding protein